MAWMSWAGFRNNLTYAAPELERLGIPALIHVATGHIGQSGLLWTQELDERIGSWKQTNLPMPQGQADASMPTHTADRWQLADRIRGICKRLPHEERVAYLNRLRQEQLSVDEGWQRELYAFLSWDEVRALAHRGFSIGSHTVSHPILTTLSRDDLLLELGESKSRIERELSQPCPWIAYPNGGPTDVSPGVVQAVAEAGYTIAFTLMGSINPKSLRPLEIDRVCVPGELSVDEFHASLNGLSAWLRTL